MWGESCYLALCFLDFHTQLWAICDLGKQDCDFFERVYTFFHASYWRWVWFCYGVKLMIIIAKVQCSIFLVQIKLVEPIPSVRVVQFPRPASFQPKLFQLLQLLVQCGMEPNVQVMYVRWVVSYSFLLHLRDWNDSSTMSKICLPCLWARRGKQNIFWRFETFFASFTLWVLSCHLW